MSDQPPRDPRTVPPPIPNSHGPSTRGPNSHGASPHGYVPQPAPPQRATQPATAPVPNLTSYRPAAERSQAAVAAQGYRPEPGFAAQPPPYHQGQPVMPAVVRPQRAPARPPRRPRRWMRGIAWTIGGLVVLTASAIAALIVFAPVGLMRDQVVRVVKERTGRDLKISGRTGLSFYPSLGVTMNDVTLSAPPQMGGAPFVQMRRLEASVPLMPLLSRQVSVDRLVLTEPVFDLRVDQRGRRSWDFADYMPPAVTMVAQAQGPTKGDGRAVPAELEEFLRNSSKGDAPQAETPVSRGGRGGLQDIALGDVRIDNGTIRYRDERAGISEEVKAINATLAAKSLTSPLDAKGSFALRGDRIDFDGRISTPRALMEERPARVAMTIGSPRASGRYSGSLSIAKGGQIDGALKLDVPSVSGLAQWIGMPPSAVPAIGVVGLEADVKNGATWLAFNNAKLRVDDINATGTVTIDAVPGSRPSLKGNLKFGAVDLNPYLAVQTNAPEAAAAPVQSAPAAKAPAKAGAQVRGFTQRTGWSEEPLNVLFLGALDADVRVSMTSLAYREIKIGQTQVALALKNRALRTTLEEMRLYGGQGRGVVTLEAKETGAALGINLTADGVAALALLKDASGFDWIDGKGKLQIAVSGQGASQRAIMETLSGKADFTFADGALVGFNIPQMIRGLSQGRIGSLNRVPTERTDFTEAGASFQIRNGVAETKDLRAASPLLRLGGTGTVNLAQRQVDMILRPKLVGTLAGQAGAAGGDLTGLELPVRIRGPWERPQIAPDLDGLLRNPNQAVDALKELGRQVQQGKGPPALNQLIDQFRRR